jgi:TonB family protein
MGDPRQAREFAERALTLTADPTLRRAAYNLVGVSLVTEARLAGGLRGTRGSDAESVGHLAVAERAFREALALAGDGGAALHQNLAEVLYLKMETRAALAETNAYLAAAVAEAAPQVSELRACLQTAPRQVGELEASASALEKPRPISRQYPRYTDEGRRQKVRGTVTLLTVIDELGNVRCARVVSGLPAGLNQEALKAAQQWRFTPTIADRAATAVYFWLTLHFDIP